MEKTGQGVIELFHGYTYSGHPLAMAAGLATLDEIKEEGEARRQRWARDKERATYHRF